jgi:hypothetical protein
VKPPGGERFGRLLDCRNTRHSEFAGDESIVAVSGSARGLASANLVVSGEVSGHPPPAGIDRHGDAVVLWDEFSESGYHGAFTATHHAEP